MEWALRPSRDFRTGRRAFARSCAACLLARPIVLLPSLTPQLPCRLKAGPGAFGNHPPLLFGQGGIDVQ